MNITRKAKVLATTAAGGAAFAYLMDPAAGQRRRDRLARNVERRVDDLRDLAANMGKVRAAVTGGDEPAADRAEPRWGSTSTPVTPSDTGRANAGDRAVTNTQDASVVLGQPAVPGVTDVTDVEAHRAG